MGLQVPRYSTQPDREVYHNHTGCTESNNIESYYFAYGTGGKRLCKHCEKLANDDALAQGVLESNRRQSFSHLLGSASKSTGGLPLVSLFMQKPKGEK